MCDWNIRFFKNLCCLRLVYGLTKKEIAEILGVSVSTYRKIERCQDSVRLHCGMIGRVCKHFKISADDLLMKNLQKEFSEIYQ